MKRLTLKHERLQKGPRWLCKGAVSTTHTTPWVYSKKCSQRGAPKGMLQLDSIDSIREVEEKAIRGSKD